MLIDDESFRRLNDMECFSWGCYRATNNQGFHDIQSNIIDIIKEIKKYNAKQDKDDNGNINNESTQENP